jgi:two-component system response regulator MprA
MTTAAGYILVVDDDASIRQLTRSVFQDEGYDVRVAPDGKAALTIVEQEAPRLVVLDLQMPIMDGRTFFRALRAAGYRAPVLLLSAYGAESAMAELGADDAIEKPYDIDELLDRAQTLLRRSA